MIDVITQSLTLENAKRLIHKYVDESDRIIIEDFWLNELSKVSFYKNDKRIYNEIMRYKSGKFESYKILYENCIKKNLIQKLIKKNWRKLYNLNMIDRYYDYLIKHDYEDMKPNFNGISIGGKNKIIYNEIKFSNNKINVNQINYCHSNNITNKGDQIE